MPIKKIESKLSKMLENNREIWNKQREYNVFIFLTRFLGLIIPIGKTLHTRGLISNSNVKILLSISRVPSFEDSHSAIDFTRKM